MPAVRKGKIETTLQEGVSGVREMERTEYVVEIFLRQNPQS